MLTLFVSQRLRGWPGSAPIRPALPAAASGRVLLGGSVLCGLAGVYEWLRVALTPHHQTDFLIYYMGGLLGRTQGWAHLYDLDRQKALLSALWRHPEWMPYWNPPPLAWLVAPLTAIPFQAALVLWMVLMAALLALTWLLVAPRARHARWVALAALLGSIPCVICLREGQVVPALAAAIALTLLLLRSGHPWLAGLVLAGIAIKPQPVFLLPLAIAAAGQWRAALSWAAATAALVALSLATLGWSGLHTLIADLGVARGWPQAPYTVAGVLGGATGLVLRAAIATAAVAVARRWRERGPEIPIVAGVVGSLATTPFTHLQDLTLLVVVGWIALAADPGPRQQLFAFAGFLALELALAVGQPVLMVETGWLLMMLLVRTSQATGAEGAGPQGRPLALPWWEAHRAGISGGRRE
ncbi:MAG: glycosyltransferase 87 family protein [Candidatus Dormibacterales bacterium]